MIRSGGIEKWEIAWLVMSLVVVLGLFARTALDSAYRTRGELAFEAKAAAAFANPVCAPLVKGPVEHLPDYTEFEPGNECKLVALLRRGAHELGRPSAFTAEDFRPSRWTVMKRFWSGLALDPVLLAMGFLPLFYGVGLVASRLRARRVRSAGDH